MGGGRWGPNYEVPYILPYIFFVLCISVCVVCVCACVHAVCGGCAGVWVWTAYRRTFTYLRLSVWQVSWILNCHSQILCRQCWCCCSLWYQALLDVAFRQNHSLGRTQSSGVAEDLLLCQWCSVTHPLGLLSTRLAAFHCSEMWHWFQWEQFYLKDAQLCGHPPLWMEWSWHTSLSNHFGANSLTDKIDYCFNKPFVRRSTTILLIQLFQQYHQASPWNTTRLLPGVLPGQGKRRQWIWYCGRISGMSSVVQLL